MLFSVGSNGRCARPDNTNDISNINLHDFRSAAQPIEAEMRGDIVCMAVRSERIKYAVVASHVSSNNPSDKMTKRAEWICGYTINGPSEVVRRRACKGHDVSSLENPNEQHSVETNYFKERFSEEQNSFWAGQLQF